MTKQQLPDQAQLNTERNAGLWELSRDWCYSLLEEAGGFAGGLESKSLDDLDLLLAMFSRSLEEIGVVEDALDGLEQSREDWDSHYAAVSKSLTAVNRAISKADNAILAIQTALDAIETPNPARKARAVAERLPVIASLRDHLERLRIVVPGRYIPKSALTEDRATRVKFFRREFWRLFDALGCGIGDADVRTAKIENRFWGGSITIDEIRGQVSAYEVQRRRDQGDDFEKEKSSKPESE